MSKTVRAWLIASIATVLWLSATFGLRGTNGLVRTIVANSPARTVLDTRTVPAIVLGDVDAATGGPAGVVVSWRGAWEIASDGFYMLAFDTPGPARWTIDDTPALESAPGTDRVSRTVWLTSGFHPIEIDYSFTGAAHLVVSAGRAGETIALLDAASLKPRPPRNPLLRDLGHLITNALGWIALVAAIVAIRRTLAPLNPRWPAATGRRVAWMALAVILAFGALLRLDAITARYGVVSSPRWIAAIPDSPRASTRHDSIARHDLGRGTALSARGRPGDALSQRPLHLSRHRPKDDGVLRAAVSRAAVSVCHQVVPARVRGTGRRRQLHVGVLFSAGDLADVSARRRDLVEARRASGGARSRGGLRRHLAREPRVARRRIRGARGRDGLLDRALLAIGHRDRPCAHDRPVPNRCGIRGRHRARRHRSATPS